MFIREWIFRRFFSYRLSAAHCTLNINRHIFRLSCLRERRNLPLLHPTRVHARMFEDDFWGVEDLGNCRWSSSLSFTSLCFQRKTGKCSISSELIACKQAKNRLKTCKLLLLILRLKNLEKALTHGLGFVRLIPAELNSKE